MDLRMVLSIWGPSFYIVISWTVPHILSDNLRDGWYETDDWETNTKDFERCKVPFEFCADGV